MKLCFIVNQWRGDFRWPYGRTAMTTVMDEVGRTVVTHSLDEQGNNRITPTYYFNGLTQQNFYPLSARRKR